jgi:hydroxyethylthiazole kinase
MRPDISAKALSNKTGAAIGISGATDLVSLCGREIRLEGGSPLMSRITGAGCLLSAIVGALVVAGGEDPMQDAAAAMSFLKLVGERAETALSTPGALGEMRLNIFDALSLLI